MTVSKKKIGISLRVVNAPNYKEKRDALSHDWPSFLIGIGYHPVLIPNSIPEINSFLRESELEGLILSGGDNIGDTPERDITENKIVSFAINNQIPIFGVCRGMQLLNQYFGGSILKTESNKHIGKDHNVNIIHTKFSNFLSTKITVNSYHKNLINKDNLGNELVEFANSECDNTIEGFFHKKYPVIGVMWHPERVQDKNNKNILKNLFLKNMFWS